MDVFVFLVQYQHPTSCNLEAERRVQQGGGHSFVHHAIALEDVIAERGLSASEAEIARV